MIFATLHSVKTKYPVEEVTAYLVNAVTPESGQLITTHEACPHCDETNIYQFVNEPFKQVEDKENDEIINHYYCKCASCEKQFVAQIEFCY